MDNPNNSTNNNPFENNKSTHVNPFSNISNNQLSPFDQGPLLETNDIFPNQNNIENNNNNNLKTDNENNENNQEDLANPFADNNNNNNGLPSFDNFQQQQNNINNNNNQNKDINPYDLNQPNIPNINYPNLNNGNPKNNSGNRYAHDMKKIRDIIDRCELLYKQAQTKYENYEIKKAINNLTNAVKGLDGLKQSITNNKTEFNSFLPRISSMRIKIFNDLHKYRLTIYQLIPRKFQPVKFYDTNFQEFIKRYILTEPFISFEDIYDPNPDTNKKIKTMIIDYYQKSQRLNYKNLLLFGPNGSGKTLAVHALANSLNGKVAQLEGLELFKIPSFSLEFVKISFNYMQFKPLIVYIRNIEKMFSNMNNFNFIYDKVCSSKINNIILIASTSILENQLPKEISQKFHYTYCIRPCEKNQKINLIKFICHKIGITLNAIDKDINKFVYKNLGNYSNEDIFNLIVAAIDCKKNKIGKGENILEQVYKEGINLEDIYNAINFVKGSMTPIVMKNYYL